MKVDNNKNHDFGDFILALQSALADHHDSIKLLIRYTSTPIKSVEEGIERGQVMDQIMDMARHENDVVLMYSNAIADRIEEYERDLELPAISVSERLRGLMDIKGLKQSDLKAIAPQSVISEILSNKRNATLKQAKGFAEYFELPVELFVSN